MRAWSTTVLLCFFMSCSVLWAEQEKSPEPAAKVDLIDALVAAPKLIQYSEDGAADASVLRDGLPNWPVKEVKAIVALKEKAIPLLIECLTDTRSTVATFHGGFIDWKSPVRVPVGHVCLDILLSIIDHNPAIFFEECADDGLGACVREGYYFRPDDYVPTGGWEYYERSIVRLVKANWQQAYRSGKIKYNYLPFWE
jgi:hypothetical protein